MSSVAVVDEESGILIGGVSVTDIGKVSDILHCPDVG